MKATTNHSDLNTTRSKKMDKITAQKCTASLASVADALYAIGGKWKLQIIIALAQDNKRFNELQRAVKGISAKVLSNELKELEMNGFVKRIIFTGASGAVEYELTEYSDTLHDITQSLSAWGTMHRNTIKRGLNLATQKSPLTKSE